MNNFLISYNYLKKAFERKNVPFPAELAAILEPISTTTTTTQSSKDNGNAVRCSRIKSRLLCYFADIFSLVFYRNIDNAL
jgi:hypothetical protein